MGTAGRDGGVRDMLRDLLRLETADGINRMNASSNVGHRDAEDWEPAHKLLATNTRAKDSLNTRNNLSVIHLIQHSCGCISPWRLRNLPKWRSRIHLILYTFRPGNNAQYINSLI